jgi:hypothetical protein
MDVLYDAEDMDAMASRTIPMARPLAVPIAFRAASAAGLSVNSFTCLSQVAVVN